LLNDSAYKLTPTGVHFPGGELMKNLNVSYLRVSTATQRENETISTQRHALERYFEQHRIKPDFQFEDDGVSGGIEIHKRPQGSEAYRLISEGRVARLFVFALDRVGRDTIDSLLFLRLAESHGTQVIGISDNTDTSREGSTLETEIKAVIAAQYRRDRVRQSKAGLRRRAAEGKISNRPPFGFTLADGRLVIDEPKAEVMRFAFRSVAQGIRTKEIVTRLNESGALSPSCMRWRHDTLIYLLKHTAYAGEYRSFITPKKKPGGGQRLQRNPSEAITIQCPAIVSREVFDAVQERLAFNRRWCANVSKRFYLLKSLLRCGECGLVYVGHAIVGRKYRDRRYPDVRYYECGSCSNRDYEKCSNARLNADRIESVVWSEIESFILSPSKVIDQLVSRYNCQAVLTEKNATRNLRRMQDAHNKNRKARERLTMAVANGIVSDDDARTAFEELRREADSLATAEAQLQNQAQAQTEHSRRMINARELLEVLKQKLEGGLSHEKKAELARRLIKGATVKKHPNGVVAVVVEYLFGAPSYFGPVGFAFSASSRK
jgi:site-specific DNA recombinase